jgi:hypothetical protein
MSSLRRGTLILAVLAAASVTRAHAQQPAERSHGRERVPVVLAMADSAMAAPGYRILRRAGGGPEDLIVFGSNADPNTFSEAVRRLVLIRRATGDTATVSGEVRVSRDMNSAGPAAPFPWAERVLGDLRAADRREVPHVGRERVVRIFLPAQRVHATHP